MTQLIGTCLKALREQRNLSQDDDARVSARPRPGCSISRLKI
jgi:hypothetical protein